MTSVTKKKTLTSVQMLLAERGYVVVGIKPNQAIRYKVGQIIDECCAMKLGQPFQVIAETTHEDWVEQIRLIEKRCGFRMTATPDLKRGCAYYRVFTD